MFGKCTLLSYDFSRLFTNIRWLRCLALGLQQSLAAPHRCLFLFLPIEMRRKPHCGENRAEERLSRCRLQLRVSQMQRLPFVITVFAVSFFFHDSRALSVLRIQCSLCTWAVLSLDNPFTMEFTFVRYKTHAQFYLNQDVEKKPEAKV